MKKLYLSLCLLFLFCTAFCQSNNDGMTGGILYGGNWSCFIEAPDGWVLDNQSWVKYNIYAMFYPKGKVINGTKNSFPIIYFNAGQLSENSDNALEEYVKSDIDSYKINKNYLVNERKINLKKYSKYYCYDCDNITTGQLETTIYVRFKDGAHLIILTTHNKDERENLIPKLIKCVDELKFGDAVIKKNK